MKACPSFSAWEVAAIRSTLAALVLFACVPSSRRLRATVRRRPIRTLLVAASYAATLTLYIAANKLTTSANAIFLQSTAPLFVLAAAPIVLRERPTRRDLLLGIVIGLGTTVLFVSTDTTAANAATAPDVPLGNALGLAAGACWAATILGLRAAADGASPEGGGAEEGGAARSVLAGNLVAAGVAGTIAWSESDASHAAPAATEWIALLYLGIVQVGLAYVLLTFGIAHVPALTVSLLLMVEPAVNPLVTWAAHGEVPGAGTWLGGGLIVGGLLVHQRASARARTRA